MGMKKLALVGNILKCAAAVALLAGITKLAATFYYGYHRVDGAYGGAFYYNWRVQYLDKKLPKSVYTVIKLSEQRENENLRRYVKMVQDTGRRSEGIFPYYAYGLPETFVLTPKKTWQLFDTKGKMDLEFRFLEFRGRFISRMYGVKYDKNSAYFKDSVVPAGKSDEEAAKWKARALKPIVKAKYFKEMSSGDVRAHFGAKENQFVFDVSEFEGVTKKILAGKAGYGVEFADGQARMTGEFEKDVMGLVGKVFRGFDVSVADVNHFWTRVMTIRPTPMDVHILNRVGLYFLYTNSYLDVGRLGNKGYDDLRKVHDELAGLGKEGKLDETKERKLKNMKERMYALRSELILNKASMLLGSVLGKEGAILQGDRRWFLERLGSPTAATAKNVGDKSDMTMFDDQMRTHLGITNKA